MATDLFELLKPHIRAPLTLIDVGGHGGAVEGWKRFGDKARIFCFEARSDEADALTSDNELSNIEYVPLALSDDHEDVVINVAAAAGCSSIFPPVRQLYERYPGCGLMRPIGTAQCSTTTIDDFIASRGVEAVHALKLDTQGFELRVLQGAEKALEKCQLILIEVEFNPLYEGQPLFGDVDKFLRDRGFVLWRLGNLAHYSTGIVGGPQHQMLISAEPGGHQPIAVPNGQLFWADAFYIRRDATPITNAVLESTDGIAGAALVSQWHFNDLALEMLRKSGNDALLLQARAALDSTFVERAPERFAAADFLSTHLTRDGDVWRSDFSTTDSCLVYGPYVRLPWGEYEVTFDLVAEGLGEEDLASLIIVDVAANTSAIATAHLTGKDGADTLRTGRVRLSLYNDSANAIYEFRVSAAGRPFDGHLLFKGVTLKNVSAAV